MGLEIGNPINQFCNTNFCLASWGPPFVFLVGVPSKGILVFLINNIPLFLALEQTLAKQKPGSPILFLPALTRLCLLFSGRAALVVYRIPALEVRTSEK